MSENKMEQNPLNVNVKLNNIDCLALWTMLRDLIEENKQGLDSGQGGYFGMEDGFRFLRCLENLAIGLDAHREEMAKNPPKLDLV